MQNSLEATSLPRYRTVMPSGFFTEAPLLFMSKASSRMKVETMFLRGRNHQPSLKPVAEAGLHPQIAGILELPNGVPLRGRQSLEPAPQAVDRDQNVLIGLQPFRNHDRLG